MKNIRKKNIRIDYKKNFSFQDDENVDDVAIAGSKTRQSMFRIEQLDEDCYWICFYPNRDREKRYVFNIIGKSLICIKEE